MSKEQDEDEDEDSRVLAREVGLSRYGLISDAVEPSLSTKQRGRLVRVSLDPWVPDYRVGEFAALVRQPRVLSATPAHVLGARGGPQVRSTGPDRSASRGRAAAHGGFAPLPLTLQRLFRSCRARQARPAGAPLTVFGRFEAERPSVRRIGDALYGCSSLVARGRRQRPGRVGLGPDRAPVAETKSAAKAAPGPVHNTTAEPFDWTYTLDHLHVCLERFVRTRPTTRPGPGGVATDEPIEVTTAGPGRAHRGLGI